VRAQRARVKKGLTVAYIADVIHELRQQDMANIRRIAALESTVRQLETWILQIRRADDPDPDVKSTFRDVPRETKVEGHDGVPPYPPSRL